MADNEMKIPGGAATLTGDEKPPSKTISGNKSTRNASPNKADIAFALLDQERTLLLSSHRLIETLRALVKAGSAGLTSGEFSRAGWARRTSAYVRELRLMGVGIDTRPERASDGARIGRYVLAEPVVELVEV